MTKRGEELGNLLKQQRIWEMVCRRAWERSRKHRAGRRGVKETKREGLLKLITSTMCYGSGTMTFVFKEE